MIKVHKQTSLELMKSFPTKPWWSPILWVSVTFFVLQIVFGVILAGLLQPVLGDATETIATLYSFAAILAGILWVNRTINKRPITTLGFHRAGWFLRYCQGILCGLGLLALIVGTTVGLGGLEFTLNPHISWGVLVAMLVGFMIQGMTEEVLMRGYLQNSLMTTKPFWFAMIGQAIVFTAIHGANPGITPMAIINLFVVAILFGMLFCLTDSLWLVGGLHFAWNFILGPVVGIEVSGNEFPTSIFHATAVGPSWLTGGNFGIEASALTTVVAVIGSALIYRKIRQTEASEI